MPPEGPLAPPPPGTLPSTRQRMARMARMERMARMARRAMLRLIRRERIEYPGTDGGNME